MSRSASAARIAANSGPVGASSAVSARASSSRIGWVGGEAGGPGRGARGELQQRQRQASAKRHAAAAIAPTPRRRLLQALQGRAHWGHSRRPHPPHPPPPPHTHTHLCDGIEPRRLDVIIAKHALEEDREAELEEAAQVVPEVVEQGGVGRGVRHGSGARCACRCGLRRAPPCAALRRPVPSRPAAAAPAAPRGRPALVGSDAVLDGGAGLADRARRGVRAIELLQDGAERRRVPVHRGRRRAARGAPGAACGRPGLRQSGAGGRGAAGDALRSLLSPRSPPLPGSGSCVGYADELLNVMGRASAWSRPRERGESARGLMPLF
jgi:hypothetical protein